MLIVFQYHLHSKEDQLTLDSKLNALKGTTSHVDLSASLQKIANTVQCSVHIKSRGFNDIDSSGLAEGNWDKVITFVDLINKSKDAKPADGTPQQKPVQVFATYVDYAAVQGLINSQKIKFAKLMHTTKNIFHTLSESKKIVQQTRAAFAAIPSDESEISIYKSISLQKENKKSLIQAYVCLESFEKMLEELMVSYENNYINPFGLLKISGQVAWFIEAMRSKSGYFPSSATFLLKEIAGANIKKILNRNTSGESANKHHGIDHQEDLFDLHLPAGTHELRFQAKTAEEDFFEFVNAAKASIDCSIEAINNILNSISKLVKDHPVPNNLIAQVIYEKLKRKIT